MKTITALLVLSSLFAPMASASGAPWCVVTTYMSSCYYYNLSSCQAAAERQRGMCVPNPDR
jgi:hypothetical protein